MAFLDSFERACQLIGMPPHIRLLLSKPCNEITLNFPVKLDDDNVEMFRGVRVQHNGALGPYLGGLRYHPSVDMRSMRTLAARRTWQAALVGIPFGGSMGGIQLDPSRHTLTELERITRRFVFALGNNIGPDYDVFAPDVGTNHQIMSWILDTYLSTVPPQERNGSIQVVTGKPVEAGGSAGRRKAVGQGIATLIQEWAKDRGIQLAGATYIVQGYGSVGSWTARCLKPLGLRLVAVEDLTGAAANPDGIDPDDLYEYTRRHPGLRGYPGADSINGDAFLRTKATIFVPASVGAGFTPEALSMMEVRLVAEATSIVEGTEAEEVLQRKGVEVLPEVLCSAGGAIVSYFEWLQNKKGEQWDVDEVDVGLRQRLVAAYRRMLTNAEELGTDWRTSCVALALSKLEQIYQDRGLFP